MVLLSGASGYVGGRLLRILEQLGAPAVRCLVRSPGRFRARDFCPELIQADLLDPASFSAAFDGVATVYLVHSENGPGFEAFER